MLLVPVVVVLFGCAYIGLVYLGFVPPPNACSTETKLVVRNVAGLDFRVEDSDCDTFAKEDFVSVYVWDSRRDHSWFRRLTDGKELLFRYYPENWDSPIPSITAESSTAAVISVRRLNAIIIQKTGWNGTEVIYRIGEIDYLGAKSEEQKK